MAELIKIPFQVKTSMDPRNHVLIGGASLCHLANATEQYICAAAVRHCFKLL